MFVSKWNHMGQLTKREEEIMQIIWRLGKAFIREIVEAYPEPKPHYNTVATLVKILEKKEILASKRLGNMHQYSPTVNFEDYREEHVANLKEKYFDNSFPQMLAHFAKKENLTEAEQAELIRIIQSKKSK